MKVQFRHFSGRLGEPNGDSNQASLRIQFKGVTVTSRCSVQEMQPGKQTGVLYTAMKCDYPSAGSDVLYFRLSVCLIHERCR